MNVVFYLLSGENLDKLIFSSFYTLLMSNVDSIHRNPCMVIDIILLLRVDHL